MYDRGPVEPRVVGSNPIAHPVSVCLGRAAHHIVNKVAPSRAEGCGAAWASARFEFSRYVGRLQPFPGVDGGETPHGGQRSAA